MFDDGGTTCSTSGLDDEIDISGLLRTESGISTSIEEEEEDGGGGGGSVMVDISSFSNAVVVVSKWIFSNNAIPLGFDSQSSNSSSFGIHGR